MSLHHDMAACTGLEVLWASVKSQIKSQYDVLVCCLHWNMVRSGFKCVGSGEMACGEQSELLPSDWNEGTSDTYTLRYQLAEGDDYYLLKVVRLDDTLLVHVLREKDEKISSISVETCEFVDADSLGDFKRMYKNLDMLQRQFKTDLMDRLKDYNRASQPSQRRTESRENPSRSREDDADPLRIPTRQPHRDQCPDWVLTRNPLLVGESDLDPFSGAPPGMLMDPRQFGFPGPGNPGGYGGGLGMPGRLPRGSVPPGARFDPIGPPDPDGGLPNPQGRYPDLDLPPGFDDMYM